jgi:hypothetical protein
MHHRVGFWVRFRRGSDQSHEVADELVLLGMDLAQGIGALKPRQFLQFADLAGDHIRVIVGRVQIDVVQPVGLRELGMALQFRNPRGVVS